MVLFNCISLVNNRIEHLCVCVCVFLSLVFLCVCELPVHAFSYVPVEICS